MSYRVKIDAFEGPFDLLLQLVSRQKVDVAAIPITQIADQFLDQIDQMPDLDLEVASDFLYVASTLLELKSAALLPAEEQHVDEDLAELSTEQTRDILVARLIAYKQYKNAAAMLGARLASAGRMHPRQAGLEPQFLNLLPDYLEGVTLSGLAVICADLAARRETFLLDAKHIASLPLSLEDRARSVRRQVFEQRRTTFAELVGETRDPAVIVVTFLAVLELYKRGVISMAQDEAFGTLDIEYLGDPAAAASTDGDDEADEELSRALAADEAEPGEGQTGRDAR